MSCFRTDQRGSDRSYHLKTGADRFLTHFMASPFARFSDTQFACYERQMDMNPATFGRLTELGFTPETLVRLDFAYKCPNELAAQALLHHLRAETDYDLAVTRKSDIELRGTTQPTAITLEILNQWVFWMCRAGVEYGDCMFDGWGTSIPTPNDT